ncbi:MAG: GH92 family glycosyl hydrolase [Dokdonella sp.]|uniref:GH92 family glycosyl hydrolase n=1 Tax=Dokdonella sp. TaxID=2291710 RepID=UPI003263576A
MTQRLLACLMLLSSLCSVSLHAKPSAHPDAPIDAAESARLAADVKAEFLHAWRGYRKYAWGHDDLAPISRKPYDWYGQSLLMTPVDALDTLVVMGLKDEADDARELIATTLDFDKDIYVKNFEITIRLLGGLLSGYQLTGDARLLAKAEDLGTRLLPVFDSATGLPWVEVNLRTGKTRNPLTNPAETGTLLLEFGTLAKLTGKPVFYDKAKRALVETFKRRSSLDLVGATIDVQTGAWTDTDSHVSGGIDSYYEYLWKCWRLFGDNDCLAMWKTSIAAINAHLADEVDGRLWYGTADMNTGRRTHTTWGALDAFFPALLAMSGDVSRASRLQDSSFSMWQLNGIEPEVLDYRSGAIPYPGYALRPEIVESAYYLARYTHDAKYPAMGRTMFRDFVKYCRTDAAYAALENVITKKKKDRMESFVFAETFKYYYLLFAPEALDFDAITFNTEAHPLRATWRDASKPVAIEDAASEVDPRIGTAHGGNVFPGAVVPFGMVQWSPETTRGDHARVAAPGGYAYDATRIRGFGLTHLSGTGCRGASGDIPFLPVTREPATSPSLDAKDDTFSSTYSHANEVAEPGYYAVRLANRVKVELAATARSGSARFRYPSDVPAAMLIRTSDSEVGSSDAGVEIDAATRSVSGSVTSGNFCGYLDAEDRRSYYTLYFVAQFDHAFSGTGTWEDGTLHPGSTVARGGTGYGTDGFPPAGKGSGAWLRFDTTGERTVGVRVGISYVSVANARANLAAENSETTTFSDIRGRARAAWNAWLSRIAIDGGSADQRRVFRTALYHASMHPNLFSDTNGDYRGFDGKVHRVGPTQHAQYANFSGWDVYRSQLQLVTMLDQDIGSDIAQSLLNQADQNGGEWDRWTHNSGGTHVMNGDPASPAIAAIHAFGGTRFDARKALVSLVRAAEVPTAHDREKRGCVIECVGQRPDLERTLALGFVPADTHAWGGAAETLEQASADFALGAFAQRLGDTSASKRFFLRARNWKNLFHPDATPHGGYIQNRNADGSWPPFDPASDDGFAEGSAAQYLWMVPFDVPGLFDALGGTDRAIARLDALFHDEDGNWALTGSGALHVEMDNEPSIAAPWLYAVAGQPWKTQATVREVVNTLWTPAPDGIPGNDDLGAMSAWYVWSALGMYPLFPGRAELVLASPSFERTVIRRPSGDIVIDAPGARTDAPHVRSMQVDGQTSTKPWLPATFVAHGGHLGYELASDPQPAWGSKPADAPPVFLPLTTN